MEVHVRIDGTLLEGINAGAVKLNINNPDPLKFSDPTVSYSGSITVPRTLSNDRVFKSERFPHLYTRMAPYVAEIDFGGLAAPVGAGLFRARVTAKQDSYTVDLVETVSKLSTVNAPVIVRPVGNVTPESSFWACDYDNALNYAYSNSFSRPALYAANGTTLIYPAYYADTAKVTASDYVSLESRLAFKGGHDGRNGAVYPTNSLYASDNRVANALERLASSLTLRFDPGSFIVLPPSAPATVYLRSNRGSFALPFTRGSVRPDGNYTYTCPSADTVGCVVTPVDGNNTTFGFTPLIGSISYSYAPVDTLPTAEGYFLSFSIKSVGTPTAERLLVDNMAINTPFEIVTSYCKAFCWTYVFTSSPFSVTLRPFINPSTSSEYRQNWTGKIDTSTITISEPEGVARVFEVKVGGLSMPVGGSNRAIASSVLACESALPVQAGGLGYRPYATMIRYLAPTTVVPDGYFYRASGLRTTVSDHYARFAKGWQATATMNLSYFDILNMKPDALYFVDELGTWCYLRSIQNWDASTGKANVTLIAVNN